MNNTYLNKLPDIQRSLGTMINLVVLKYGNLDADISREIDVAKDLYDFMTEHEDDLNSFNSPVQEEVEPPENHVTEELDTLIKDWPYMTRDDSFRKLLLICKKMSEEL